MNKLHLHKGYDCYSTIVSNIFIDRFMASANGEFVKIYLYLLRCVEDEQVTISVSGLADFFNQTEADVCRALKYWDKQGVIRLSMDETGSEIADITFVNLANFTGRTKSIAQPADFDSDNAQHMAHTGAHSQHSYEKLRISLSPEIEGQMIPASHGIAGFSDTTEVSGDSGFSADSKVSWNSSTPADSKVSVERTSVNTRTAYSPKQISALEASSDDFAMMLYGVNTMLGGTLTSPEMSVLAYFYDTLHFSSELIEYLIEYCITNDHRSFRYIEKVALSWHEKGITTVREAKTANMNYNDTTYDVLDAFGIKDRSAGRVELDYINRWNEMFGNNTSIIVEACNRTMRATHKPSFEYADTILMRWKEANVKNPDDIKRIDESYEKSQADKKRCASNPNDKKGVAGKNKFNNFELQGNIDVDALEKAMLSKNDL